MANLLPWLVVVLGACEAGTDDTDDGRGVPAWPAVPADATAASAPAPPLRLTASDGTGLPLTSIRVRAVVYGPLAFTELELAFDNAEPRVREGTFTMVLPDGATVARLAMAMGERWQEAALVETARARHVYEDFLHHRQDPALLERGAGPVFAARVFPIAPGETKRLRVGFSHVVPGGSYHLPLRGLPRVGQLDAEVAVTDADGQRHRQRVARTNWTPDQDLVADVRSGPGAAAGALRVLAVTVPGGDGAAEPPTSMTVVLDTSASMAVDFAGTVDRAGALLVALGRRYGADLPLQVVAFDQEAARVYRGPASGLGRDLREVLIERGAEGASDLGAALAGLAADDRLLLLTDGVMTAGAEADAHRAALARFGRVDVVLTGDRAARAPAEVWAGAGRRRGSVHALGLGPDEIAHRLGQAVVVDAPVVVDGASSVTPRVVTGQPGDTVLVLARGLVGAAPARVRVGAAHQVIPTVAAPGPLLDRAVATAELDELDGRLAALPAAERDGPVARTLHAQLVARSQAAQVMTRLTSYLVLETEADYERFAIPREGALERLGVDEQLELTVRREVAPAPAPSAGAPASEAVFVVPLTGAAAATASVGGDHAGVGAGGGGPGWGSIGVGRYATIGDGAGLGLGRSRVSARPPARVRVGNPTSKGQLDRSIVRRYLRRSHARFEYCYDRELVRTPDLAGAIAFAFVIDKRGLVSAIEASGLGGELARCAREVLEGIRFPTPLDGITVLARFTLTMTVRAGDTPPPEPPPPVAPARAPSSPPWSGRYAEVMTALEVGPPVTARVLAQAWQRQQPGDVLAWLALAQARAAGGDHGGAARALGSLIDLFPHRADLRRVAGSRLVGLGPAAGALAVDTLRRAVVDRPDHATGHRLLAYALWRSGDHAGALAAALAGFDQRYPDGRFAGAQRVLGEDAGMMAAVMVAAGARRGEVELALAARGLTLAAAPSSRLVLSWETDTTDVDLNVRDARGDELGSGTRVLASGGELYADVTTGYGPECFVVPGRAGAGPYQVSVRYVARGPMGYGLGLVGAVVFDGARFTFDDRPFVIMADDAVVELGAFAL